MVIGNIQRVCFARELNAPSSKTCLLNRLELKHYAYSAFYDHALNKWEECECTLRRLEKESIPWACAKIVLGVVKSSNFTQARLLQLRGSRYNQ